MYHFHRKHKLQKAKTEEGGSSDEPVREHIYGNASEKKFKKTTKKTDNDCLSRVWKRVKLWTVFGHFKSLHNTRVTRTWATRLMFLS